MDLKAHQRQRQEPKTAERFLRADVAIIGGGLGGCAAALAAARLGHMVILTEETRWVGGQLTSQAVQPDEHPWIEVYGATASYRALRRHIRDFYRAHLPLTHVARSNQRLNPGNGWVSKLCHDPRIAVAVLQQMMMPYEINGRLTLLLRHRPIMATTEQDRITGVIVQNIESEQNMLIQAPFFIDATPLGDLLALAEVEHVLGAESQTETCEPHAPAEAEPDNQQAITFCFAMEHRPGEDHTIDKPGQYERWRDCVPPGWPGKLFNWTSERPETHAPLTRYLFSASDGHSLWRYRRIFDRALFADGFAVSDITMVNWPQNDYWFGPVCDVSPSEQAKHLEAARQLSLSWLYWLQTDAPRPDGGLGYPGLRLRSDVVGGTSDGLAQAPYVRESRRIRAEFTVLEQHIAYPLRSSGPEAFDDSVGIGCYRIDIHPSASGAGYLDLGCWPFQIPLGAMIPVRVDNLLPGGKNLGVTHITNGAFRVHPVEWNVGETAGLLASFCLAHRVTPRAVRHRPSMLGAFQSLLQQQGVALSWPMLQPL